MIQLGIYPKDLKTHIRKDICTVMFIAALFIVARTWKQRKCPLIDDWLKELWYIYTMEYYSAIEEMKYLHFNNLDGPQDNHANQNKPDLKSYKSHDITYIWDINLKATNKQDK